MSILFKFILLLNIFIFQFSIAQDEYTFFKYYKLDKQELTKLKKEIISGVRPVKSAKTLYHLFFIETLLLAEEYGDNHEKIYQGLLRGC